MIRANEAHLFCDDELRFAYDWMSKQLTNRVGNAPDGVRYPVWAWYQWEGKRKRRDLRFSGYARRGTPMVQIEFEIDSNSILLSDFDDWHLVLNNSYIADSEEEFDEFYAAQHTNEKELIEESWHKIFHIGKAIPNWTTPLNRKSIQATLWEIRPEYIKKIEHFVAK